MPDIQFDSTLELAKPSQVIFYMLELALRDGQLSVENERFVQRKDIGTFKFPSDDVDEYIERLIAERKVV